MAALYFHHGDCSVTVLVLLHDDIFPWCHN